MDVSERVQICRLIEKIYNNPEYAEKIKVSTIEHSGNTSNKQK